jgi:hypothetical protein
MRGPKPADAVRRAVVPVVEKFLADKQQQQDRNVVQGQGGEPVLPGPGKQRRGHRQAPVMV